MRVKMRVRLVRFISISTSFIDITFLLFSHNQKEVQFEKWDSSYPDICISSRTSDFDCKYIPDKKLSVTSRPTKI